MKVIRGVNALYLDCPPWHRVDKALRAVGRLTGRPDCHIIHVMNNFCSQADGYLSRWLTPLLRETCAQHPVVVLTGARQVGKTTLLRHAEPFASWRYHSLDLFDVRAQAQEAPASLWADHREVILDEVQHVPEVLSAVKQAVDEDRSRRFILSGSANLSLLSRVSESLAGRAVYLVLHPMTLGELHGNLPGGLLGNALAGRLPAEGQAAQDAPDLVPALLRGFMPALLPLSTRLAVTQWWQGYVATYLERDLRQLSQIENLLDFRRLMELAALRSGQILNQSELARDAGISQATAHRYLDLLEASHLFERLPAYTASRTSRLVKSPKAAWSDPGLAVFLSGYYDEQSLRQADRFGCYVELLIYHHARVLAGLLVPPARLYYWRTRSGVEVDFVVEHGRNVLAMEVKSAERVGYGDGSGLRRFLADHPRATGGLLLYGGTEVRRLGDRVVAVPWSLLTG